MGAEYPVTGLDLEFRRAQRLGSGWIADGTVPNALLAIEALPEGITMLLWVMNPVKLEAFARSRGRASARDVTLEGSTRP